MTSINFSILNKNSVVSAVGECSPIHGWKVTIASEDGIYGGGLTFGFFASLQIRILHGFAEVAARPERWPA